MCSGIFIVLGLILLLGLTAVAASFILSEEEKKSTGITGKIIAVIDDDMEKSAEYAVKELVGSTERLKDRGVFLDIYIVNKSKSKETQKILEILSRKYDDIHIIKRGIDIPKSNVEILHNEPK